MDRPGKFGRGLAVLIKTLEIKFKEIAYNQSKPREGTTEAQAKEIFLTDKTIPIINVYHHDNTSINTGLIETLSEASSDIAIILGDLTPKDQLGDHLSRITKGTMMRDRFVAGIKSEILQKKLLQEDDDVTLDKIFAVAISFELAEINTRELQDKLVAKISPVN
ncbi:hypothetical protein LAZ67_9003238 [Cordylochernes scorpioides]|uniref:Uncharacterized protein n=1 Tax=Cordylochernes scorpioides TaxID=51811 RepID=A0ABY6KUC5_9ARAC|nr:hypothetical protein LAZ67_9003238 [Cordylochernes scorpioides]